MMWAIIIGSQARSGENREVSNSEAGNSNPACLSAHRSPTTPIQDFENAGASNL